MWTEGLKHPDDREDSDLTFNSLSHAELREMAEWSEGPDVEIACAVGMTGLALPDGTMIGTSAARKLAAQLLLMSETHDTIYDKGFEAGAKVGLSEAERCRTVLRHIVAFMKGGRPVTKADKNAILHEIESLGIGKE